MKFKLLLATAVAAGLAAPALAQIPTSTSDIVPSTSGPSPSDVALSDQALRDIAACVIRYQGPRTRNLLGTIPGTREESTIRSSLQSRMRTCYDDFRTGGRALVIQNHLLRGAIAEAHLASAFPSDARPASRIAPELTTAWVQPRPSGDTITQMEMLHSMARCVTAKQPDGVRAMLRAAPLSTEEMAALRPLQPDLAECLDSGVEFTASRQALRALLAEAAFHYEEAQSDGFATSQTAARD